MDKDGIRRRKTAQYQTYGTISVEETTNEPSHREHHTTSSSHSSSSHSSSSHSSSNALVPSVSFQTPQLSYLRDFTQNALYSLTYGLEYLWMSLLFLPNSLSSLLSPIASLLGSKMSPEMEARLRREVDSFRERVGHCYDASKSEHEECLRHLWELAFPDRPLVERETKEWQDLGFQGKDPATDFRGAGIFGLCNLLYFGRHYPASFYSCIHKSSYPFAIAGLSITNLLFESLGFGMRPTASPRVRECVASLVFFRSTGLPDIETHTHTLHPARDKPLWDDSDSEGDAVSNFNELFCFCFAHLDDRWRAENATYMDFPRVLQKTREELERKFVSEIRSIREVILYNEERSLRIGEVPSHIPAAISRFNSTPALQRTTPSSSSSSSPPSSPPSSPSSRVSASSDGSSPLIDLTTPSMDLEDDDWANFDQLPKGSFANQGKQSSDGFGNRNRSMKNSGKAKEKEEEEDFVVGYTSLHSNPSLTKPNADSSLLLPSSSNSKSLSVNSGDSFVPSFPPSFAATSSTALSSSSPLIDGL